MFCIGLFVGSVIGVIGTLLYLALDLYVMHEADKFVNKEEM